MIGIARIAAWLLSETVVQVHMQAGGSDMLGITSKATTVLKQKLLESCFEAGIGFRMLVAKNECGEKTLIIRPDRAREGDEALELDGVRIFIDRISAVQAAGRELDCLDDSRSSFLLR